MTKFPLPFLNYFAVPKNNRKRIRLCLCRSSASLGICLLLGAMHLSSAYINRYGARRSLNTRSSSSCLSMAMDSRELRFLHSGEGSLHHSSAAAAAAAVFGASPDCRQHMIWAAAGSGPRAAVLTASATDSILSLATSGGRGGSERSENNYNKSSRSFSSSSSSSNSSSNNNNNNNNVNSRQRIPRQGYGPSIHLTPEERSLFTLLGHARHETHLTTTLRVAGGWVRDKLLATPEFQAYHAVFDVGSNSNNINNRSSSRGQRLTSKFQKSSQSQSSISSPHSMGRQGTKVLVSYAECSQPVDIDIALDDMLGREFADRLNEYLSAAGEETVSVGVVLKNPEKSKHLETATMKVDSFWIDFVNLRAEEYTQDSRIPDLMRIGTPAEDAFRRDLTINSLFYNINSGEVEDWTGRGFDDLKKGIVATPLAPLTTLLDDPLRVLRSVRFAARLRFSMDDDLVAAAKDVRVRTALAQKVSRERVGGEVDLMLRSPDPVGAMRLLINLKLVSTVFPVSTVLAVVDNNGETAEAVFGKGLSLLSTSHDHLVDCRLSPPLWCQKSRTAYGTKEVRLSDDDQARRFLWYASFLKPLWDDCKHHRPKQQVPTASNRASGKKGNRSVLTRLLVDELKRPTRDAESIERIVKAADDFTQLLDAGCDISATMILLGEVRVTAQEVGDGGKDAQQPLMCFMSGRKVESATEEDPVWEHAMEFRLLCSEVLRRVGPLWRAALFLSISEQLVSLEDGLEYAIEGDVVDESQEERRRGIIERFDAFAAALQQMSLIGIWNEKPLLDGKQIKTVLPRLPTGPAFRDVMAEQVNWMTTHPGAGADELALYLQGFFPRYAEEVSE